MPGKYKATPKPISITITRSSAGLRSLYIPREFQEDLIPGTIVTVTIAENVKTSPVGSTRNGGNPDEESEDSRPSVSGSVSANGVLSGMALLYKVLKLTPGDQLSCEILRSGLLQIKDIARVKGSKQKDEDGVGVVASNARQTVAHKKRLKSISMPEFSKVAFINWKPVSEVDVYLAFGTLQRFTSYRYCCGISKQLLRDWGVTHRDLEAIAKADAVLKHVETREYLIAEFKMKSSSFPLNHKPEDVDVLVVWEDDAEKDRIKLPTTVIALQQIAQAAFFDHQGLIDPTD